MPPPDGHYEKDEIGKMQEVAATIHSEERLILEDHPQWASGCPRSWTTPWFPRQIPRTPKAGAALEGDGASPVTTTTNTGAVPGGRPRTLHQRIMDKKMKEVEA
ncbi:unnamed protein product [Heligmosomoides polygyrus]|uniref:Uncharacterized protein n=1 Tax=Heligmosomoides polygyrus TaxID=6339 RepID=A0A3P7YQH9_HELPZ|nr:unnamed protein product [Heligmosomoides polygyrus]